MIKKYFLSVLLLSFPGVGSESSTDNVSSNTTQAQLQNLTNARAKGGTRWYYLCQQLSREGREHGDIFLSRYSIKQNRFSLTRYCIVNGEPDYIPQLTAEVLNAWLGDWTIARMNKERENCHKKKTSSLCAVDFVQGRDFTFYSADSRALDLQPGYWRLAKKLLILRQMLDKNWELYRASIPTTISRFEQALDEIATQAGVFSSIPTMNPSDLQTCLTTRETRTVDSSTPSVNIQNGLYLINNSTILDPTRLPRTHNPSLFWTPLSQSSALSCMPKDAFNSFFKTLITATNSKLQLEEAVNSAAISVMPVRQ